MPTSIVYKVSGPTQAMSVVNTSTANVTVTTLNNEPSNYLGLLNVGGAPVIVTMGSVGSNPPTPIFPTTTSGPVIGIVIPPLMEQPMLVAMPNNGCVVGAISNSSTATTLLVTPMGNL